MNTSKMIVYALSHPLTGQIRYIGKSESGLHRPKQHGLLSHLKSKAHLPSVRWINKLKAEGLDYIIEIVEEFENRSALMEGEKFYISYFRAMGFDLLNICDGGEGFTSKHTPEARAKIAAAGTGRLHRPEAKQKLSTLKKGKPLSEAHKAALRKPKGGKGAKGQPKSKEHAMNISKGRKAMFHSNL